MKIVKNDGIQTLLAGLGPTTWGYLFEGAVKFGIYEVLKPAVRQMLVWLATVTSIASLNNKVLGFVLCGGVSGVAASLMLCPMEALRIRLVSEPDFDRGGGWVNGFLRMVKYEGVGGLWKGINAMMLKQGAYFAMVESWPKFREHINHLLTMSLSLGTFRLQFLTQSQRMCRLISLQLRRTWR